MVIHLAAVDFRDLTSCCDHRDHERAVEVLMATLAQDPDALQRAAQRRAFHPVLLRQPVAQRAIGKAELERADRFLGADPAPLQVFERFGALQQCSDGSTR